MKTNCKITGNWCLTNMFYWYIIKHADGSIAQLGEHLPYKQRVTGSSPVVPTKDLMVNKPLGLFFMP